MRHPHACVAAALLVLLLLSCGCAQEQKAPAAGPAAAPAAAAPPATPAAAASPYPDAKPLNGPAAFGTADMTGSATVTKYSIKQDYAWTSPAWRSARQQAGYAPVNEAQPGYNTEKPADGNTFLFVFFKVATTGSKAVYAPSPQQIVVSAGGKTYSYRPVSDVGVTIGGIAGTQYDYLVGKGGTGGYVQPGASNAVEGYLIYEVPAGAVPGNAFVLANLDYQTRAVWALA